MNASIKSPHIPGWVKVTAALIVLTGLLLGGILAAPVVKPVQAQYAFPQIRAPQSPTSTGVNGTLASFTALIPQSFSSFFPYMAK